MCIRANKMKNGFQVCIYHLLKVSCMDVLYNLSTTSFGYHMQTNQMEFEASPVCGQVYMDLLHFQRIRLYSVGTSGDCSLLSHAKN